jgi:catalase
MDSLAEQVVDAINDLSGAHPGHRAAHAKGTLLEGSFTATPAAAALTSAAHMQGEPVRATIRFSNGSGDPETPDYAPEGRGMAVKLYLPDGARTDIVMLNIPVFFVRTPEDFLEFTRSRKPDPATGQPDLERIGAFLGAHPEAQPAIQAALSTGPPASYAQLTYHGIHSFRWIDPDGGARYVRYRFEPEEGEAELTHDEARELGPNYLQSEILSRAGAGFRMWVRVADDDDPVDDPTAALPDDREEVEVGRLELGGPETGRERGGDVLVFDPTRVVAGIELSGDPILSFRAEAYSASVARRIA